MLYEVRLWVAIEIGTDATMSRWPIAKHLSLRPWVLVSSRVLQSIAVEVTRLSGRVRALILQTINADALRDHERVWPHSRLYFVHSYCKRIMNILPNYTNKYLVYYRRPYAHDTRKLCVNCHSREFLIVWIVNF